MSEAVAVMSSAYFFETISGVLGVHRAVEL